MRPRHDLADARQLEDASPSGTSDPQLIYRNRFSGEDFGLYAIEPSAIAASARPPDDSAVEGRRFT